MKNKAFAVIFVILGLVIKSNGQENIIKTSVGGPLFGEFSLNYERLITENSSLNFKIGYWKPTMSPFFSGETFTPRQYTFKENQGTPEVSIEYRFYVGKAKSLNGLYVAPYLRNWNMKGIYTDEIDGNVFNVDAKIHTYGIGAQLGYQWIINETFAIDFSFFGAGVDFYNLKLVYTIPLSGFDYSTITDNITNNFEDVKYLQSKLRNTVNPSNETSKIPFLFPGFRLGLHVGVAF